jgi:hypothetical protein
MSLLAGVFAYCLIAVVAYWPVSPFSSAQIMACGCHDAAQEAWFLAWPAFALSHLHSLLFTTWIGYPSGVNLATNTSMPLLGALAWPVTKLAGPVASYNFVLRLGFAASATSAFWVLRHWTPWTPAAFIGGLVYGFSPYMVGEGLGHAFAMFVPLPPLIFLVVEELVVVQARPAWQAGVGLGVLVVAQCYISTEILITTCLFAVLATAVVAVARPRSVLRHARHGLAGVGYAAAVVIPLCGYAVWFAFRGPQHIVGPPHSVAALAPYHADLLSAVIPTQSEYVTPFGLWGIGNRLTGYDITETGAYIGIPLLIALVFIVVRYRDEARMRVAALLGVAAFALSLGARLLVDGFDTHIPLPFAVLTHLPVLQGLVAGRFSLYTGFFAAVVLAIGLGRLHGTLRGRRPAIRRGVPLAVAAVCLLPLVPNFPYHEVSPDVPAYFTSPAVDQIPAGSVVLGYPYPYTPDVQAMLWEADAGMRFKIIGGQAAIPGPDRRTTSGPETLVPPTAEALFLDAMYGSPRIQAAVPPLDATTLTELRAFCVRYDVGTVIVDPIGEHPGMVISYLTAAFGAPPVKEGGVGVWYHADRLAAHLVSSG